MTAAAALGQVSRSGLAMVEADRRSPNPAVLVRLTRGLGVQPDVWLPVYLQGEPRCQRLVELAKVLFEAGDYEAARLVLGRAYFISRRTGDGRHNAEIYHMLGRVRFETGRYAPALRWFLLFEQKTLHTKELRAQAIAQYNVGITLGKLDRRVEAAYKLEEAIRNFKRMGLTSETAAATLNKANVLLAMRHYSQAGRAYTYAAHLLRGKQFHDDAVLGQAIVTWRRLGAERAEPMLRRVIASNRTRELVRAKARCNLTGALREMGRYDDALLEASRALSSRNLLPYDLLVSLLTEETLCRVLRGDLVGARRPYEEYCRLAGEAGEKDAQDIAVMRILASVLGVTPSRDELPKSFEDAHDERVAAALRVLGSAPKG